MPTLPALGWPAGERTACVLLTSGFAALAAALWLGESAWIRLAGVVVAAGAATFALTLARVLRHLMPRARQTTAVATPRADVA